MRPHQRSPKPDSQGIQDWSEFDYARSSCYAQRSRKRYRRHVENMPVKLFCQECSGEGGFTEVILDDGTGPWFTCGWCEGTGFLTPHGRGTWLSIKRQEKMAMEERGK